MVMITKLHYVEFSCSAEETEDVISEIWRHVHVYGRQNGNCIGVDFPEWSAGESLSAATLIRVFGEKESLVDFIKQPRNIRLLSMWSVARSAILPAPADHPYASIRRDSSSDKKKPSHARRRERRGNAAYEATPQPHQFDIPVSSQSTKQSFLMKLKKTVTPPVSEVRFGGYGMCQEGSLPQF